MILYRHVCLHIVLCADLYMYPCTHVHPLCVVGGDSSRKKNSLSTILYLQNSSSKQGKDTGGVAWVGRGYILPLYGYRLPSVVF